MPQRWQSITGVSDDPVQCHICASLWFSALSARTSLTLNYIWIIFSPYYSDDVKYWNMSDLYKFLSMLHKIRNGTWQNNFQCYRVVFFPINDQVRHYPSQDIPGFIQHIFSPKWYQYFMMTHSGQDKIAATFADDIFISICCSNFTCSIDSKPSRYLLMMDQFTAA